LPASRSPRPPSAGRRSTPGSRDNTRATIVSSFFLIGSDHDFTRDFRRLAGARRPWRDAPTAVVSGRWLVGDQWVSRPLHERVVRLRVLGSADPNRRPLGETKLREVTPYSGAATRPSSLLKQYEPSHPRGRPGVPRLRGRDSAVREGVCCPADWRGAHAAKRSTPQLRATPRSLRGGLHGP